MPSRSRIVAEYEIYMDACMLLPLLLLCYCPGPKQHGKVVKITYLQLKHEAAVLSRLCRSADVPGIRLQIRRAQGPGGAFHSLLVLGRKLCLYCS